MLTFYDAFHGIGGFRYGLEQAGMKCVGGCEIDKYACQAYGVINDEECRPTDIRAVDAFRLPDFDCLLFGWPCQDNSIAGKRRGQKVGTRSGLLFEAARIMRTKKPKYFIAENVEGLFSGNDGLDFYQTIRLFTDLGYDCQWQLLNTRWFLPQNRERIFFVGHLRGGRRPEIFPIEGQDGGVIEKSISVVGKLEGNHEQNSRIYGIDGIAPTLGTMQGGGQVPKIYCVNPRKLDGTQTYQQDRIYRTDGILPALTAQLDGRFNVLVRAVLTPDRAEKRQNGRRFKEPGEPMFTLTTQDRHGIYDGYDIRNLTPLECFRLQGYPDEWYYKLKDAKISNSQLYKMAGNGVSVPPVTEIAKRLAAGHLSTESA